MNLNFGPDEPTINWGEEYFVDKEKAAVLLLQRIPQFIGDVLIDMIKAYVNTVADNNGLVDPKYLEEFDLRLSRLESHIRSRIKLNLFLPKVLLKDRPLLNRVFDNVSESLISSDNISGVGCGQNIIVFNLDV